MTFHSLRHITRFRCAISDYLSKFAVMQGAEQPSERPPVQIINCNKVNAVLFEKRRMDIREVRIKFVRQT